MYEAEERWLVWPVAWSAVWVGALAALMAAVVIGLIGVALGAHSTLPGHRIVRWRDFSLGALVFSVVGGFFSFVLGGWVSARIAGIRRADTAALHGIIAWLVATPLLLVLVALGGAPHLGGWYGGLTGAPAWVPVPSAPSNPDAVAVVRNAALGGVTTLLLGFVGALIGGWMASGERMALQIRRRVSSDRRRAA
jgi:hypothetical protein